VSRNIVVIGAGGYAREVAYLIEEINRTTKGVWNIIGCWDNIARSEGRMIRGIPVIGREDVARYASDLYAVAAIGHGDRRERAVMEAEEMGIGFATLIHPSVTFDRETVSVGEGTVICVGATLTVDITIGRHVLLNYNCTIGHDCCINDFATVSPGANLSGYTQVGRCAYIGAGAVTVENHTIGDAAIVGAGAVVTRDVPAGVTVAGIPAKALTMNKI
jgi:sugar O-acyltransferase (sialic acid O-acetyltransferase NeuD family)